MERTFSLKMLKLSLGISDLSIDDIPKFLDDIYDNFKMSNKDILLINLDGINVRFHKNGSHETEDKMPSVPTIAKNLAGSAVRTAKRMAQKKKVIVPNEVLEERKKECASCDKWHKKLNRCRVCGCKTNFKLRLAQEKCPHPDGPKWDIWSEDKQ